VNWTKERVLAEFHRAVKIGEGVPPGQNSFAKVVPERSWRGKFWARYSDLVREAGFEPKRPNVAQDTNLILERFMPVIRRLGRWPTEAEQQLERRSDPTFPDRSVMRRRFASQEQAATKVLEVCSERADLSDVEDILRTTGSTRTRAATASSTSAAIGVVYLLKSGRYYKIGMTKSIGRRTEEIRLVLPEPLKTIHYIETDDPAGIEAYWHRRFAEKRRGGEWFDLTADDVAAFKRRKKFM
jgi:hypothetical protein